MKINFYLPGIGFKIIGGYKIVYQYANYLDKKGHDIYIYYDTNSGKNNKNIPKNIMILIRKMMVYFYPYYWIKLSKKIKQVVVNGFCDDNIRDADISIATAYRTSGLVNELSIEKGKKVYFIQGYEEWGDVTNEMLISSYKLDMKKIVISEWLKKIVEKHSKNEVILVSNGIDTKKVFKCNNEIDKRENFSIIMLYHTSLLKGAKYGIEIVERLKKEFPQLKVQFFGFPKRNSQIPDWIDYKQNASEVEVAKMMNENAIYICTSIQEGFGLPGLEAMACGCALVTTNCEGILEYANKENAMISEVNDYEQLYKNIKELLENREKRIVIAKNGLKRAKERDLELKCIDFENAILQ